MPIAYAYIQYFSEYLRINISDPSFIDLEKKPVFVTINYNGNIIITNHYSTSEMHKNIILGGHILTIMCHIFLQRI